MNIPDQPPKITKLLVTKKSVALSQLETAIWIWFEGGDPVSIHTLTVAAHDCFDALIQHGTKKQSVVRGLLQKQSGDFNKRVKVPQNFYKHGWNEFKKTLIHIVLVQRK